MIYTVLTGHPGSANDRDLGGRSHGPDGHPYEGNSLHLGLGVVRESGRCDVVNGVLDHDHGHDQNRIAKMQMAESAPTVTTT